MTGLPAADIERIAAFLDRRLPEAERAQFLERLDNDPALYEVFVETVRYREESAAEGGAVVEYPAPRDWTRWMGPAAIAAMLALVVVGPLIMRSTMAQTDFALALAQDEGLDEALGDGWHNRVLSQTRGDPELETDQVRAAFRAGVRALELEVALRLGRLAEATQLTTDHRLEVDKLYFLEYPTLYDAVEQAIARGDGPEALQAFLELDATVVDDLGDYAHSYAFGNWAEAGRLAAQRENESLLRARPFRDGLRDAMEHEWKDPVPADLEKIAAQIDQRGTTLDYQELEETFGGIVYWF